MTQGMEISLDMRRTLSSKWTTAVLSHHFKGVKEQRVDSSSRFRDLNLVRCTLIAGKPVFWRTVHPYSHNKLFIHTISNKQHVAEGAEGAEGAEVAEGSYNNNLPHP
jgi:hypothetical protein